MIRRRITLFVAIAAHLSLIGTPARSDVPPSRPVESRATDSCALAFGSLAGHGYCLTGRRWSPDRLPINFRLNETGAPIDRTDLEDAAILGATEWDAASPVIGTGPRQNNCPIWTRIVCVSQFTFTGGVTEDGVNTILWAHLGAAGPLALTYIWPAGGTIITDVDIVMNSDVAWYWMLSDFGIGATTGVASGVLGGLCVSELVCPNKFDLQGVFAHEFGHALGLGHMFPGRPPWPSSLEATPDYTLVMYEYMYPNSSLKRTLGWGDVLGLERQMLYTLSNQ